MAPTPTRCWGHELTPPTPSDNQSTKAASSHNQFTLSLDCAARLGLGPRHAPRVCARACARVSISLTFSNGQTHHLCTELYRTSQKLAIAPPRCIQYCSNFNTSQTFG